MGVTKKVMSALLVMCLAMSTMVTAFASYEHLGMVEFKSQGKSMFSVDNIEYMSDEDEIYFATEATVKFTGESNSKIIEYCCDATTVEEYWDWTDSLLLGAEDESYKIEVKGDTELTKPGIYYIVGAQIPAKVERFDYPTTYCFLIIDPKLGGEAVGKTVEESKVANKASASVAVNGTNVAFDAYNIDGNNYFKLRDLAKTLSGTAKQFDVSWDNTNKAINLVSGAAYTVVGGELATGAGTAVTAVSNTSAIYKDGAAVNLTAYTINENNYFKLRDIGQAFNFSVTWDGATNTINIDTTTGYEVSNPSEDLSNTPAPAKDILPGGSSNNDGLFHRGTPCGDPSGWIVNHDNIEVD